MWGSGRSFNNLGVTYYQWGQYEPALEAFRRSLEIRRRLGDERGLVLVLANLGNTYRDLRLYDRALPALEEALALARRVGQSAPLGYALHNLGLLHMDMGRYDDAVRLLDSSTQEYQRLESEPRRDAASGWALNQVYLGLVHSLRGDVQRGVAMLEEIRAIAAREGFVLREAMALLHLGRAHRASGDLASSLPALDAARTLSGRTGQRAVSLSALEELAEVHRVRGETALALQHLRSYHALRDSVFSQNTVQRIAAAEAQAEADRRAAENARLRGEQAQQDAVINRQRLVVVLVVIMLLMAAALLVLLVRFNRLLSSTNAELAARNSELTAALSEVRALKGLIPICASCKKVRDDDGFWEAVETYISSRSDATFNHSICSDCGPRLYGSDWTGPTAGVPASPTSTSR